LKTGLIHSNVPVAPFPEVVRHRRNQPQGLFTQPPSALSGKQAAFARVAEQLPIFKHLDSTILACRSGCDARAAGLFFLGRFSSHAEERPKIAEAFGRKEYCCKYCGAPGLLSDKLTAFTHALGQVFANGKV
jgi:hypothetical protein